ncbi:alpha-amylase [candidate division KSB1 bacterium]|nr:alpha-amylase [candidate division KSB1 bacterium]
MANDMPVSLKNACIYELFIRNHTPKGNFISIIDDLERIRTLGVDIIWLMPVHPIGQEARKGSLGSPYAIADFRNVHPGYGSMDDLELLIDEIHFHKMKIMLDIVFHHTSPDSVLARNHSNWFNRDGAGQPFRKVDDWSDIIDLDYSHRDLWEYQIETLKQWTKIQIDGFRCDVAPMIPVDFWSKAWMEIAAIRPDMIWLAETLDPDFTQKLAKNGHVTHTDDEICQVFDMTYDYEGYTVFKRYMKKEIRLIDYVSYLIKQDAKFPQHAVKLRFLENHDTPRAAKLCPTPATLSNWTAFQAFLKGAFLIYAGQELAMTTTPSLFERETVNWKSSNANFASFIARLCELKKSPIFAEGKFTLYPVDDFLMAKWEKQGHGYLGIFNVQNISGKRRVELTDGRYPDQLSRYSYQVENRLLTMQKMPLILKF